MLSTHSLLCSISLVVCECVQKCHKIFIMFLGSWIISSHKMYDIEPLIWATAPLYNGQNGLFSNFNRPSGTMFSIQSHHVWWLATSLSQCIATSIPYDVTVHKSTRLNVHLATASVLIFKHTLHSTHGENVRTSIVVNNKIIFTVHQLFVRQFAIGTGLLSNALATCNKISCFDTRNSITTVSLVT